MKKKIIDVFLMALLCVVTIGSVVSCKDYEEDNYADLNRNVYTLNELNDALKQRVEALENAKKNIEGEIAGLRNDLDKLHDGVEENDNAIKEQIDELKGRIATLEAIKQTIDYITQLVDDHWESILYLDNRLNSVAGSGRTLEQMYDQVAADSATLKLLTDAGLSVEKMSEWDQAVSDASAALTRAHADSIRIDSIKNALGDDFEEFKDSITNILRDANGNWKSLNTWLEEKLAGHNYVTRQELKDSLKNLEKRFEDSLVAYQKRNNEIHQRLKEQIDKLNTRMGIVETALNKFVTGVIIQGTKNPVYGTFALPVGISSNVLAAYYGTPKSDFVFPMFNSSTWKYHQYYGAWANDKAVLDESDFNMILDGRNAQGFGRSVETEEWLVAEHDYLISDEEDNAGTLYLTVNPVDHDHTEAKATLENSVGVTSPVMLSTLAKSEEKLSFGYTRAGAEGFYEAKARVYEEYIKDVKPNVSYDELKDIAADVKDIVKKLANRETSNLPILSLASSLYSVSTDVLDANAVKFSWYSPVYDEETEKKTSVKKSVVSNYALAATAVKPLSYTFWAGANYTSIPGFDAIENMIGGIMNDVKGAIPNVPDNIQIDITMNGIDPKPDGSVKVIVNVTVPGQEVPTGQLDQNGDEIKVKIPEQTLKPIEVDITDKINDILDDVNESLKEVINNLNSQIGDLNEMLESLQSINNLGNTIDDIENKIINYLNKTEDIALRFINNANKLLQPVVLAGTDNTFVRLSGTLGAPTKFKAGNKIYLYPTSYTAEILAPAYQKFVAITNVYLASNHKASAKDGNSNCKTALKTAYESSSDLALVLPGDTRKVEIKGLQSGYVYEIAYSAVDYSGKVAVKKCYVQIG